MTLSRVPTQPTPVNILATYYGPQEDEVQTGKGRNMYRYAFNETASLIDLVAYQTNVQALITAMRTSPKSLQGRVQEIQNIYDELDQDPAHDEKTVQELVEEAVKRYVDDPKNLEAKTPAKQTAKGAPSTTPCDLVIALTKEELDVWLDPVAVINQKYEPAIREHFQRRVDLFLMQLLNCNGTHLHFEVGPTQHQAQSSKSLYVQFMGEKHKVCERGPEQPTHDAAHSSTFPCLIAYDNEEWEKYEKDDKNKPMGIYFLQHSDLYKATNSTCNLPRLVNHADIAVDGRKHNSDFSNRALLYINQVSKGEMSIKSALPKFLEALRIQINGQIRVAKDLGVKAALCIYQDELEAVEKEFTSDDQETWILSKADVLTNREQSTNGLRAQMLRLRSQAILRNMRGQTALMADVNKLAQKILKEIKQRKQTKQEKEPKAPNYFSEAFRLCIIDAMTNDEDKIRMKKIFSLNVPEAIKTRKTGIDNTKQEIKEAAVINSIDRIKNLAKKLSLHMHALRTEEMLHRGDAMRALRVGRKWSQEKLGRRLERRFPSQFSSQSTMSRTERGERLMDNELARQLSETFRVPKELLLPQVFFN